MSFFKRLNAIGPSKEEAGDQAEPKESDNATPEIAAGCITTQIVREQTQQAAKTFAKPASYAGNRNLYDSGAAKRNAKAALFSDGQKVYDRYNNKKLVPTKAEAKSLYHSQWQEHLAESDHVIPLKEIHDLTQGNTWNTTEDIKNAANSEQNICIASRSYNNKKRSRTNEEFVNDDEYLSKKKVSLTPEGKQQAISDSKLAKDSINKQLSHSAFKNAVKTGHEAGIAGAKNAGMTTAIISACMNITAVWKGEKDVKQAAIDIAKDSGKAAAYGYVVGGGLTMLSHTFSNSKSKFLQGLAKSNVPAAVITSVIVFGNTLKKWGNGEITTQECLIEVGEKGLNMATVGSSMALGQALIPIPIVGAAIGALVGSVVSSSLYRYCVGEFQRREFNHRERMRIISECRATVQQAKAFHEQLQAYLDSYFREYREFFDSAISSLQLSFQMGDSEGVVAAANSITRNLGGRVAYESIDEFRSFLDDDSVDIL